MIKKEDLQPFIDEAQKMRFGINIAGVLSRGKTRQDQAIGVDAARIYQEGREAFLAGDLQTVAEMFALLR